MSTLLLLLLALVAQTTGSFPNVTNGGMEECECDSIIELPLVGTFLFKTPRTTDSFCPGLVCTTMIVVPPINHYPGYDTRVLVAVNGTWSPGVRLHIAGRMFRDYQLKTEFILSGDRMNIGFSSSSTAFPYAGRGLYDINLTVLSYPLECDCSALRQPYRSLYHSELITIPKNCAFVFCKFLVQNNSSTTEFGLRPSFTGLLPTDELKVWTELMEIRKVRNWTESKAMLVSLDQTYEATFWRKEKGPETKFLVSWENMEQWRDSDFDETPNLAVRSFWLFCSVIVTVIIMM